MRVAIDATALGSDQGGDESMVRGLLEGLASAAAPGDSFPLVTRVGALLPAPVVGNSTFPVVSVRRLPGLAHFTVGLPGALARLDPPPELVCAVNHAPVRSPAPVALFVQDLSFEHHPEHYPPMTRARLRLVVPRQARRARAVLTVSDFSRRDLVATYELAPEHVHTVPDAVPAPASWTPELAADGKAWLARQGVTGRFLLSLGNLHPRKNVPRLIEAFTRGRRDGLVGDDVTLVIAGARWWGSGESAAADAAPPGSVVFVGRIDDRRREQLLRLADALAYVSLFEGFGLPPIEAMARGTPVVASRTTAVGETAGPGALLVDPEDVDSIGAGLARVLGDAALREELVRRGHARAAELRPEVVGIRAHRVLGELCADQERSGVGGGW